ncbi:MAG: DUF3793 family protein [Ruminiclostridium sp.]|nr:DUF3793 family protein [Ruminiclostridium sp.]
MSAEYVIRHGAPTLAGLKTGNLFPCSFDDRAAFQEDLRRINQVLVPRGLRLIPLRMEERKSLLYLFRPAHLDRDLANETAQTLLKQAGYADLRQRTCLRELSKRLQAREDFPHEIGLFLSYPPEDVQGFICHQGKCSKCTGCWKVYGDERAAKERFAAYKTCTADLCRRHADGDGLECLTVPTPS